MNYKNRNYSSNVKDLQCNNLKGKYNMTPKDVSNILNEPKKNEEYYKKEYINIEPVEYTQYLKQLRM